MKDNNSNKFSAIRQLVDAQLERCIGNPENSPEPESVQQDIRNRWGRCAGNAAEASFPLLFRDGRLVIFTESAIWATELRHRQQSILDELGHYEINRIEVKARPASTPEVAAKTHSPNLSEANCDHLRSTAGKVGHPGLQAALRRLANSRRKKPE